MNIIFIGNYPKNKKSVFSGPIRVNYNVIEELGRLANVILPTGESSSKIKKVINLISRVLSKDVDIIVVSGVGLHTLFPILLKKIGLINKPIYYIAHGLVKRESKLGINYPLQAKIFEIFLLRYSDVVCCVSNKLKKMVIEDYHISNDRLKVIPNGVHKEFIAEQTERTNYAKNVLFVGGTRQIKGLRFLIEAIENTTSSKLNKLIIAGPPGDIHEEVMSKVKVNNKIEYIGVLNQEQLNEIYRSCDIFVLPSIYESFGLVALEAMAMGLPTILSTECGVTSIISHRDDSGIKIVESGNTKQLKDAIDYFLNLGMEEYSQYEKNVQKEASKYTWDKVAEKYYNLFNSNLENQDK